MAIGKSRFQEILHEYDRIRTEHAMTELARRNEVYQLIPAIREIDEEIPHISVMSAKRMVMDPAYDCKKVLADQIRELTLEKRSLLVAGGFPEDYLDHIYDCPVCKDTGYVGDQMCTCLKKRLTQVRYERSNLMEILDRENFSTFRTNYYSAERKSREQLSPLENIEQVLDQCWSFVDLFDDVPGQNLLIYGPAGVGKTFLSHCIAKELLDRDKSVIYLTSHQFFEKLADYTFRRDEENEHILEDFLDCELLIIDDLGTELHNNFVNSQLFLCVNERILRRKSTVINTNLSLSQLSQTYSERVFSRMVQSYRMINIYGEDIRILTAMQNK